MEQSFQAGRCDTADNIMKKQNVNEKNFSRLAAAIMQFYDCDYESALNRLVSFKLKLICGKKIKTSRSLQAGLITAVNCGKRAFHGGVDVYLPEDNIPLQIKWKGRKTLNEVVEIHGGSISKSKPDKDDYILTFGKKPQTDNSLQIITSGWRGGVISNGDHISFKKETDLELSGIAAASLGVARAFLKISGILPFVMDESAGLSLWRPDMDWTDKNSDGPKIDHLPERLWILGLGHLGQAYLWNLSFLYGDNKPSILLQDFDYVEAGNYSSGLLLNKNDQGLRKTRIVSEWLERQGFTTIITERKFDKNIKRVEEEPRIALCGFDSASSRALLENAGFDLIIESALGGNLSDFDSIQLHTFPSSRFKAAEVWNEDNPDSSVFNEAVLNEFKDDEKCGIFADTLASKAISTSFVGAFAGSLVVAELLKSLHQGIKSEFISTKMRSLNNIQFIGKEVYTTEAAKNGFIEVQS